MDKLDPKVFTKWEEAAKNLSFYRAKLDNRALFIIKRICQEFNTSLDYVNRGPIYEHSSIEEDSFVTYNLHFKMNTKYDKMTIISKNGLVDLVRGFPLNWLTEDFEKELIKGKKAFEEKEAKIKQLAKNKEKQIEANKEKLKRSAASKLTKEERKVLGL